MEQQAEVKAGEDIAPNLEQVAQETPPQDEKKPEGRVYSQEEFDRIAAKIRKNARYLGRKEAEAELASRMAKPPEPQPKPQADPEPKRDQFQDYESFIEARADFRARKAVQEERQKAQKESSESSEAERRQKTDAEFRKRLQATASEVPDFADVMENAGEIYISAAMRDAIQESPLGPRIIYELAKNPQEADRLAGLSPSAAAREIGKMEARLEAAVQSRDEKNNEGDDKPAADERNPDGTFKPKKEPSKAPPPPKPVGSRSAIATDLPDDKDDPETWRRKEVARLQRLRGGK